MADARVPESIFKPRRQMRMCASAEAIAAEHQPVEGV